MSWDCRTITGIVTAHLRSKEGAEEIRELMARGASAEEISGVFADLCDGRTAVTLREEFEELPRNFVYTFLMAWSLAASEGRPFTLASAPPARPMEYARRGRVSYEIVHDEDGVTMYVSHVHGRHADWFKQAALNA